MKSLLPELQTGGEIILLKWRIPHPPTLLTHPPMPVGANLNESHQRAKWSSRGNLIDDNTVQYQLPPDRQEGMSLLWLLTQTYRSTHTHTQTHTYLCSFIRTSKTMILLRLAFSQYYVVAECQLSFAFFVHVPVRSRVEWI